jgi:hypothetical protein
MISVRQAVLAAGLSLVVPGALLAQEAKSIVADLMTKGKGAFNDFKYKQADSLGRKVLSYSVLLSAQQKVEAMQLVVAASYPEDEGEQKADVAIDYIKQLLTLGAKQGIPRELSWAGLDSLFAWVQRASTGAAVPGAAPAPSAPATPSQPAQVRLGSNTPEAFLYINDKIEGAISTAQYWNIPGGVNVKLSIKSVKCSAPWDTTVNVASGTQLTIGRRFAGGCQ